MLFRIGQPSREEAIDISRGYFGIGILNGKEPANIGTLWRSAGILGAKFIFTIGERYKHQATDTARTPKHIPLYHYKDKQDFFSHVPTGCPVVAVELADGAIPLQDFHHPERCIYLLGAEDTGVPANVLGWCDNTVQIIGDHCYNVAVAGSIVMYDRAVKIKA